MRLSVAIPLKMAIMEGFSAFGAEKIILIF